MSVGVLIVATVLLAGLIITGYGYFEQDKVSLFIGLVVIVAGVLNGVVRMLVHGNR